MTAGLWLGIALLGGAGAVARVLLDGWVTRRARTPFPAGILAVNLLGAAVLGLLLGLAVGDTALRLLATGLLASFTTFSTWMLDSHRLGQSGRLRPATANLLISLGAGLAATWAGREVGATL